MDWTTIVNDLGIALAVIGGLFGINKKFPFITTAATYLETHASEVGKVIEEAATAPIGAAIQHELHKKIDEVTVQLQNSEIAKYALVGLHSFASTVDGLSDTQKEALIKFVTESVPAEWNVNRDQILNVINDVQSASNAFSNLEIVKAANYFTETQKQSTQPATTTPTTTAQ